MPQLTAAIRGGQLHADVNCNGCGQHVKVPDDALPAFFASPIVRGLLTAAGPIKIRLPGLYFGECCEMAARDAFTKRNAALTRKAINRGRKK